MTTHTNQSKKLLTKISSINQPLQKVGRRKSTEKRILNRIRTPDLEAWNLKLNWNRHSMLNCSTRCRRRQAMRSMITYCITQWSNGCSLGSLLFPRQNNHVQGYIKHTPWTTFFSAFQQLNEFQFHGPPHREPAPDDRPAEHSRRNAPVGRTKNPGNRGSSAPRSNGASDHSLRPNGPSAAPRPPNLTLAVWYRNGRRRVPLAARRIPPIISPPPCTHAWGTTTHSNPSRKIGQWAFTGGPCGDQSMGRRSTRTCSSELTRVTSAVGWANTKKKFLSDFFHCSLLLFPSFLLFSPLNFFSGFFPAFLRGRKTFLSRSLFLSLEFNLAAARCPGLDLSTGQTSWRHVLFSCSC